MGSERKYTFNFNTSSTVIQKIFFLVALFLTLQMVNGENVDHFGSSGGLQIHDHKHCKHQHPKAHEVSLATW